MARVMSVRQIGKQCRPGYAPVHMPYPNGRPADSNSPVSCLPVGKNVMATRMNGLIVNDREAEHRGYGLLATDNERERRRLNAFYGGFAGVGYGFGAMFTPGPTSSRCVTDPNDGDWPQCPPGWGPGPQRVTSAEGTQTVVNVTQVMDAATLAKEKANLQIVQSCMASGGQINYDAKGNPSCGGPAPMTAAPPPLQTNMSTIGATAAGLVAGSGGGSTINSMINSLLTGSTGGGAQVKPSSTKTDVEYALAALAVLAAGVVGYKMWKKRHRAPAPAMAGYRRRRRARR